MHPKDTTRIANSVDPDQTAVWSGSALFAQTCLSKNLGSLQYLLAIRDLRTNDLWNCILNKYLHSCEAIVKWNRSHIQAMKAMFKSWNSDPVWAWFSLTIPQDRAPLVYRMLQDITLPTGKRIFCEFLCINKSQIFAEWHRCQTSKCENFYKCNKTPYRIKYTLNVLNIRTPKKFVEITLKFELCGSTIE